MHVASLREALARDPADPDAVALVEGLSTASAEFGALWSEHEVRAPSAERKRILLRDRRQQWCAMRTSST